MSESGGNVTLHSLLKGNAKANTIWIIKYTFIYTLIIEASKPQVYSRYLIN